MSLPTTSTKKRLIFALFTISLIIFFLLSRLVFLQIVKGEELKKGALEQWTRGIEIKPKRGIIYDRTGKKLALSVSSYTVWCTPADVENPRETAEKLAKILDMDEDILYEKITKNQSVEKIKQWISKEEALQLRSENIKGINIIDDNKRYYPYGNFAAHILGFTDIDNNGLYGIERTYNKYLKGVPGKWIKTTDSIGRELPNTNQKIYEAKDGLSVVLTLDETIQHFAEKAALENLIINKAKNVSILVMDPNTGDILAMATKPDYNPNNPREPLDEDTKKEWEGLSQEELQKKWYDMWRNFPINDSYEPGSTFKIITAAAGLEEGVVTPESQFYCGGYITDIPGVTLKCWRYYNPHGSETFVEGVQNSCNVVFVDVGRRLGKERMIKYIKGFGFGERTGIDLLGEQAGLIPQNPETMREVRLATISYGQGIAVTPIQLITAVSAVANGGNLMEPRLVDRLVDKDGNVIHQFEPKVRRKVISKQTSETLLGILETVVSEGTGKKAYVPGYRVAGKTGTAQKVIDGKYASGKYVSSFVAVAPADDPKIAVLVVIDEPSNGAYYGGMIAAPVAAEIVENTLKYLNVEPKYTEEEEEKYNKLVLVPDVRNKTINEAANILSKVGLKYNTETLEVKENSVVIDQFPLPNTSINKGSFVDLYVNEKRREYNKIVLPDLTGNTKEEAITTLNKMGLTYKISGNGIVSNQFPKAGTEVDSSQIIEIELEDIE